MDFLRKRFEASPVYARVVPFIIFLAITSLQGSEDSAGRYWFYLVKTLIGAWLVWEMKPYVQEMRWAISWEAVVVGIAVCVMWVGINDWYPKFSHPPISNPRLKFAPGLAWTVILVHLLGSTFVVPPLEEVFYRSFLYRYFVKVKFLEMPLNQFHALSFFVTAFIFGPFQHIHWLAGIICGMAYQWLVIRKNRIGDSMTAHAITNFLLGVWVVWKNDWQFW